MKKKILSALVIFGLAFGMFDAPIVSAQEAETESVVIEYETEQVDGENYGYIPASYTIPVYESETEVLDEYAPGLNGAVNIPAYYNAVEEGHVSSVKNQGGYGTCWAFAAISSAESDAIIDGRFVATDVETEPDYSEAQLAWFTYNRLADPLGGTTGDKVEVIASGQNYLTIGGNSYYSTMALASWISPAEESVMPYEPYDTNYPAGTVVDSSYGYESCVAHLQDAYWISMSDPDSIKQMIMEYGSLDSSICYSNEFMQEVSVNGELTSLFYNPVDDVQNHEISLVGWDDTIDAGLFTKTVGGVEYTPSGDGAWLVKNSYGTTMHNDGYFWISYYDTSLMYYDNSYNMATVYNFESTDNYDYNYQYDGSYALVEVSGSEYTESIYTANVFTAQNSAQQLEAVGFYTTVPNMKYSIQVYEITEEGTPLGEPLMTAPVEGIEPYAGYHTVELSERVILDKGERFSVVVKSTLTTSGYVGKGASAFLDMSTSDGNLRYTSSGASGQSYLSYDGSNWDDMYARYGANLRVKAFTNYRPVESVDILEDNCSISIDGDITLAVEVTPSNATILDVIWSSDDEDVVTVDAEGKVTAVGAGNATITATAKDGAKTDSCTVRVKERHTSPAAPTLKSKTETTITLNEVENSLYSMDKENWQSSNVFEGLNPGTGYTFYIMRVEDENYSDSLPSKALTVTTDKKNTGGDTGNTGGTTGGDTGNTGGTTGGDTGNTGGTTGGDTGNTGGTTGGDSGNAGGSSGDSGSTEEFAAPKVNVNYRTHIQSYGWEGDPEDIDTWCVNGEMSGTEGESKRLEGINIVVNPATACEDLDLGIQYTTHCQNYGWLPWSADGDMNGTEGESKRLEAIMIKLTGDHAKYYDVYYRVHAQSYGWLGWAKNGEAAGTAGYSKRLEGIQIVVVKKDEDFNHNVGGIKSGQEKPFEAKEGSSPIVNYPATSNTNPIVPGTEDVNVAYRTHVQTYGWQGWKYNGQMSGTEGESKRLEGIEIKLTNKDYEGGIAYTTHVQTYGWQGDEEKPSTWMTDGEMSGTSGESKRLEAIRIKLTGQLAEHYDIYYRVHAQSYGWLGWAKNGEAAGTAGYSKRLEGIQIVIVPRGDKAPSSTYMNVEQDDPRAYISR